MLYKETEILFKRIKKNEKLIGSWLQSPSINSAKIMIDAGYDWLCVDLEHGEIFEQDLSILVPLIQSNNIPCFVRVRSKTAHEYSKIAELGVSGIFIPNIRCEEDINFAYDNLVWPPRGKRGVGYSTSNSYGKKFKEEYENEIDPIIVPMIENVTAVKNIDTITRNTKAEVFFIGPYDLSASLGITGQFQNAKYVNTINQIQNSIKKQRKTLGIHVVEPSIEKLKENIQNDINFIAYGIDTVFLRSSCEKPSLMNS